MSEGMRADVTAGLSALSDTDLQTLRLATQVFRHRSVMLGRASLERFWADLGRAVDFELARHGIGFVVGEPQWPVLGDGADGDDRQMLADDLGLLVDNEQLAPPIRLVCAALRDEVLG